MRPADFALERYFARWEFSCKHNLCASGIEGWPMADLLALADDESRRLWQELALGYTETAGHPLLRAAIATRYPGLSAEDIHCYAGAQEAIGMLVSSLIEPDDHVVVVRPAYQSLFELARARGAELTEVWLRHEDGFVLDPARIAAALRPTTKLVVINFPHNPTGVSIDRATQAAIVELVARHGCWLLSDEVYRGLERGPGGALPPGATLGDRIVSVGAMAKAHGLAGLRIGWLATRDRALQARAAALKDYGSMGNAAPSEILALIALRHEREVLARSSAIVAANLPRFEAFMAEHAGRLSVVTPTGGVTAFPRFTDDGVDADAFCEALVRETGVLLLPGSKYGVATPSFRIGFGRRDFGEGLAKLDAYLRRSL